MVGCGLDFCPAFRMQLVMLRNEIEDPFDTNLCTLTFIILSGVVALASGHIVKKSRVRKGKETGANTGAKTEM